MTASDGAFPAGAHAATPVVVRLQNGQKIQEQMIVQLRQPETVVARVVVHGPYGLPRELPE